MRNMKAVFIKQMLSFFKNPAMLGTPIAFLLIPLAILLLVPGAYEDIDVITAQFVVMFVGISMIGTSSGLIMEDRVTMNLRFMGMAGVKPYQYMVSICAALIIISMLALVLFALIGGHSGDALIIFLTVSMLGAMCSMLFGITLSLSKLGPFAPLFGMLLGIGPMFSEANEFLAGVFHFVYTHHVNIIIREGTTDYLNESLQIIFINMIVVIAAFVVLNSRYGLDGEKMTRKEIGA